MAINVPQVEQYIRQAAARRGIDPDVAVRAARSEGLAQGVWQSNVQHPTRGREPSYGPFQLLVGGQGGWPTGMGNAFMKDTGLDPRDPANVNATIDYALDVASREGWQQWYGPKHAGIGRWDGVKGAKPAGVSKPTQISPAAQSFVNNNPQPGGFGPGISDPNSASPAPSSGTPSPSPFGSMFPGIFSQEKRSIPVDSAELAFGDKEEDKPSPIAMLLSSLKEMPAAPLGRFPGGPSQAQANALTNVLNSPTPADLLLSKRMRGLRPTGGV